MTAVSRTPVSDLINDLLSQGVPRDTAVQAGQRLELALGVVPGGRLTIEERREKERTRKARYRAERATESHGTKGVYVESSLTSKSSSELKKERKKESVVPPVPRDIQDGWPGDYEKQFWENFPKKRRGDRPQVFALLAKLRREKTVTWETLFGGVMRYAASDPGDYAKAPLPWLRGFRWEIGYENKGTSNGERNSNRSNGRHDPIAAAAAARFGGGGRNGAAPGPADPLQPAGRMGDDEPGAGASRQPAFDLDLEPRR